MQIKRLSAVFGRLRSETIQFSDGLNIIEAPNESGKSTWCAFLTAMLYGINSRERDRADYIADKNRYAPWDGTVMAGSMDCRSEGRDITISRDTRRQTAPMAEFRAVYSGTNIAIDGLTGQNCGEALLGVTREVFERSAFIRQSGLAISQDAGLERRVAALISSGEEDTSYTEAYDALKKQLNRRRYNKSGLLPALEAQQAETQAQLNRVQQLRQQETALHAQLQDLIQQQAALSDELEQCDRWEAAQKQRQLSDRPAAAQQAAQRAQAMEDQLQADHVPDTETIGRLRGAIVNLETVRKSVDKARADRDEAMKTLLRAEKAVNDSPFAGQTVEEARKEAAVPPKVSFNAAPALAVFFLMLAAAIGVTAFTLSRYSVYLSGWQTMLPWSIFAVIIAAGAVISRQMQKRALKAAQNTALCKRFGTADADEITALAETYAKAVEILKEKIDTTKFKIFAMRFQEGEELSNDLSSISLDMVNADNYAFRQAYYLDGRVGQMNDYSTSVNEIDYAKIKGISLSAIDPAAIGRQIEEAKQLLPEGHTFQSVSVYEISEVLPRSTGLMNRGRDIGAQEAEFKICFTEDGKETETSGGQVTHLYYEAKILVNADGTITPEEE